MHCNLIKVQQTFPGEKIYNIDVRIQKELERSCLNIRRGAMIAIAVGSRGIANIPLIIRRVAEFIRAQGGLPFIVPAMGSHGGATAKGQQKVLATLGISEKASGVPVRICMDVVELPSNGLTCRMFMDRCAYEAEGVILINRIKPHTDFHGQYESGLCKMAVIGLGKHAEALEIHARGALGLRDLTPRIAKQILSTGKIILGLAIVENARDETMLIRALRPKEILDEEPALLTLAKKNMPKLPVSKIDVLIIDRLGKDVSGTGIDPNIIGRLKIRGEQEPKSPSIKNIVVCDITPKSHGNALGVGLADVITKKLFEKIDFAVTYENVITTTFLERGKIPVVAPSSKRALEIALRACTLTKDKETRVVRILDTLHLDQVYVSRSVFEDIKHRVHPISDFVNIFDSRGELKDF